MEDMNKAVLALATLISINNKRIKAYQSLEEKTHREDVRLLCVRHISHSKHFINNLSVWRSAYGGFTRIQDKADGNTAWQQIRSLLGFGTDLIDRCIYVEQEALKIYRAHMPNNPVGTTADLQRQVMDIEKMLRALQELSGRTVGQFGYGSERRPNVAGR